MLYSFGHPPDSRNMVDSLEVLLSLVRESSLLRGRQPEWIMLTIPCLRLWSVYSRGRGKFLHFGFGNPSVCSRPSQFQSRLSRGGFFFRTSHCSAMVLHGPECNHPWYSAVVRSLGPFRCNRKADPDYVGSTSLSQPLVSFLMYCSCM